MISLSSTSKVYIHCPANVATGGVELLHQLASFLHGNGISAYIVFYGKEPYSVHQEYLKYNVASLMECDIEDSDVNIEVYTEVMCEQIMKNLRRTQKLIWWMSVDNYYAILRNISIRDIYVWDRNLAIAYFRSRLKRSFLGLHNEFKNKFCAYSFFKNGVSFCYQCDYIKSYLSKLGVTEIMPLSDYINVEFNKGDENVKKEDIVLYNPAKGFEFTNRLIHLAPDINWVPIQNLTRRELLRLILRAKLYVDFGNHPGKDRLPRECAIAKCCIITGKRGSAAFDEDVNIPTLYKFDENKIADIGVIISKIRYVLSHYDECIADFECYRENILLEKDKFEEEVLNLFRVS